MTPTPNPTAEQIVRATLLRCQFDTLGDKVADVVKDLRANGLLSEGAPSEAQARAIRKLDNVQAILAGAQASVTDAVQELSLTSAALVAAQGAAPQVESADCDRDRMGICKRCGMGWDARKVLEGDFACPVLPSSAVDEDALAEVIGNLDWGYMVDGPSVSEIARAVAEWLKGQGRGSEM